MSLSPAASGANEMLAILESIEADVRLGQEKHFNLRLQAIDDIEFQVIDRIGAQEANGCVSTQTHVLKQSAEKLKSRLEEVNNRLFHRIRAEIAKGAYRGNAFTGLINQYMHNDLHGLLREQASGYNNLDIFLNGLLSSQPLPAETRQREPGMVYFQKTPARIIFKLAEQGVFTATDVFFDLGSGLGQVAMLVNLLTNTVSKGVEFEPAYCSYATNCLDGLGIKAVEFINADARYADYSSGTVFFLYTPFEGKMFCNVLQRLQEEAKKRTIKIFGYGPCVTGLAKLSWLIPIAEAGDDAPGFGGFCSACNP